MVIVLCIESPNACMIDMRCNQSNIFDASLNPSSGDSILMQTNIAISH